MCNFRMLMLWVWSHTLAMWGWGSSDRRDTARDKVKVSSQLFAAGVNHAFLELKNKTVIQKALGSDVCGASLTWETQTGVTISWHRESQEYNCGMAVLGLKRVSTGVHALVIPAHQPLCKHALEGVTATNLSPFSLSANLYPSIKSHLKQPLHSIISQSLLIEWTIPPSLMPLCLL